MKNKKFLWPERWKKVEQLKSLDQAIQDAFWNATGNLRMTVWDTGEVDFVLEIALKAKDVTDFELLKRDAVKKNREQNSIRSCEK